MTEASAVRFATAADTESIIACLRTMHDENGLFTLSEGKIRNIIECALTPSDGAMRPIIGVIGEPGNIEATICLMLTQLYYTDEWHLGDMWNFIRPDCRKKNLIDSLLDFGAACSEKSGYPFMSAVVSNKRTEAKVRIYRRHFGEPLGAFFLYRPTARAA